MPEDDEDTDDHDEAVASTAQLPAPEITSRFSTRDLLQFYLSH